LEAGGNTKTVPDLIRLNWNPSWISIIQENGNSKFCVSLAT
jgi:cell wall assembly regulator SMI1